MTENAPGGSGKTRAQDLFGILACMLGGFSAVSVFLAMEGQESRNLLARPVEGAMTLFGSPGALVVAAGLAVLGTIMFLGRRPIAPVRHLLGIFALGLGVSLVVGGVRSELGGLLGSALPEALPGIAGQAACLAIGVTVLVAATWVVWLARLGPPRPGPLGSKPASLAGVLKPGSAERQTDGVSVAEARALQGAPIKSTVATMATGAPGGNPARSSPREGSSGPFSHVAPARPIDAPARPKLQTIPGSSEPLADPGLRARAASPVGDAARPNVAAKRDPPAAARPIDRQAGEARAASAGPVDAPVLPLPTWESAEDEELDLEPTLLDDEEAPSVDELGLARGDAPGLARATLELDEDLEEVEDEEPALHEAPLALDDEDELDSGELSLDEDDDLEERVLVAEVLEPASRVPIEAALDELDEDEPYEEAPEPAPSIEDARIAEGEHVSPARWEQVGLFDEPAEAEHEPPVAPEATPAPVAVASPAQTEEAEPPYVLTPRVEPRAEPRPGPTLDLSEAGEGELDTLTYEAGCLVLEENRVAVSMLQKRFQLDFDQACEVLDRLQGAGLIGPYVGGRSREILLSKEEWESVAHA